LEFGGEVIPKGKASLGAVSYPTGNNELDGEIARGEEAQGRVPEKGANEESLGERGERRKKKKKDTRF